MNYFNWRNSQYLFYEELMPCSGFNGKVILDYGCGPGNDMVGFLELSKPKHLYGIDISQVSLKETEERVKLHMSVTTDLVELILIKDGSNTIPIKDEVVDYIHCCGVLHHVPNLDQVLCEFKRILKPRCKIRIMVYNRDSVWFHLYVAYLRRIVKNIDRHLSTEQAFKHSTDGYLCPIARCFTPDEFIGICRKNGFNCKILGAAISLHEMSLLDLRYSALENLLLETEHQNFLKKLKFDEFGRPWHNGVVAGVDACYELTK